MTEIEAAEQEPAEMNALSELWAHQFPDGQLEALTVLANSNLEVGVSVTVMTHGLVIAGETVSGGTFFRSMADDIEGAASSGHASGAAQGLATSWREFAHQRYGQDLENDEDPGINTMIHLRNAELVMPGGLRMELGLWRCRLISIDGWRLGRVTFAG